LVWGLGLAAYGLAAQIWAMRAALSMRGHAISVPKVEG
jgi:hypothetical protein